ncbi:MAG: hypothetical protein MZV63_31775 [Marinilabiliales bacterium]|nr:hypothetical protein [Marinilabiliales bacterium]
MPGRATPGRPQRPGPLLRGRPRRHGLRRARPARGPVSATGIVTYVETTAALLGLSEFAAVYWPRVKVLNPARSVFGTARPDRGPALGHRLRASTPAPTAARPGGVYDPPAGIDKGRMLGVLGFETDEVLEERKRDLVYPKRINPLTTGPGLPRYIDGSRTLKGDGNFPYVAERRGVIFVERSLKAGLQFARHKNNTEGAARPGAPDHHRVPAHPDEQRRVPLARAQEGLLRRRLGAAQHAVGDLRRQAHRQGGPRHEQAGRVHRAAHQPGHPGPRGRARRGRRVRR